MEMCIGILIVLFQLIHQSYSTLLFPKALGAHLSDLMIPLSHRPFETAALVTIWKFVKPFIYVLHVATARNLCAVK